MSVWPRRRPSWRRSAVSLAERSLPSAAVRDLRRGDFDLVVTFDHPAAGDLLGDGLEVIPLVDDAWDLVVPREHALAGRPQATIADLVEEDWILPDFGPGSPSRRLIARGCAAAGFEPRIAFRLNDCHMTQAMVAAGEGIALPTRYRTGPLRRFLELLGERAATPPPA